MQLVGCDTDTFMIYDIVECCIHGMPRKNIHLHFGINHINACYFIWKPCKLPMFDLNLFGCLT